MEIQLIFTQNNKLKITREIIDLIKNESMDSFTWKNLICGSSGLTIQENGEPFNDYDDNLADCDDFNDNNE